LRVRSVGDDLVAPVIENGSQLTERTVGGRLQADQIVDSDAHVHFGSRSFLISGVSMPRDRRRSRQSSSLRSSSVLSRNCHPRNVRVALYGTLTGVSVRIALTFTLLCF